MCNVPRLLCKESGYMKRQFCLYSIIIAIFALCAFAMTSCSAANDACVAIGLAAPQSDASRQTDDGAATAVVYYYTVRMTGGLYDETSTGSFTSNSTGATVSFDRLPVGGSMTASVEIHSFESSNLGDVYTGTKTFTVNGGLNAISIDMADAVTYVGSSQYDQHDGTEQHPYASFADAIAAVEKKGVSPLTYNFYKLVTSITVSTDDESIAPTQATYIAMNGMTLTWANYSATKPLFSSSEDLVVAGGTITGNSALTGIYSGITSIANSFLGKTYPQTVFETTGSLALCSLSINNLFYTGSGAAVVHAYAADGKTDTPEVYVDNSTISYIIANTNATNYGTMLIEKGGMYCNGLYMSYCYGTKSYALYARDSDVVLYNSNILSHASTSAAPVYIGGGSLTLCGSWISTVSSTSYETPVVITDNAKLTMQDTATFNLFDPSTFTTSSQERTAASSSSPKNVIVLGSYTLTISGTKTWTQVNQNALALGSVTESGTAAGSMDISGDSSILGLTYVNSGSSIKQTGDLTSTVAATIDFDTSANPSSVTIFESSDYLLTAYFKLYQGGYQWSGTQAVKN